MTTVTISGTVQRIDRNHKVVVEVDDDNYTKVYNITGSNELVKRESGKNIIKLTQRFIHDDWIISHVYAFKCTINLCDIILIDNASNRTLTSTANIEFAKQAKLRRLQELNNPIAQSPSPASS